MVVGVVVLCQQHHTTLTYIVTAVDRVNAKQEPEMGVSAIPVVHILQILQTALAFFIVLLTFIDTAASKCNSQANAV